MIKNFKLRSKTIKNPSKVANKYKCSKCNGSGFYRKNWHCGHCCGTGFLGYFLKDQANISGLLFKQGEQYKVDFCFTKGPADFIIEGFFWKNDKSIQKGFVPVNQICMEIHIISYGCSISVEMPDFLAPGLWPENTTQQTASPITNE